MVPAATLTLRQAQGEGEGEDYQMVHLILSFLIPSLSRDEG